MLLELKSGVSEIQQRQGEDRAAVTLVREAITDVERQIAVLTERLDARERPVPETPIERFVTEAQAIEMRELQQQLSQRVASLEGSIQRAFTPQQPATTPESPAMSPSEPSHQASSRSGHSRHR
jgi:chromosome segregation ATPase